MIELRYNADGKLEYRTTKLVRSNTHYGVPSTYTGETAWNEWKIVPSDKKETVEPTDNSLRTERVTLEITHNSTESVATQKFWDLIIKPDPYPWLHGMVRVGELVRVVDLTAEAMQQSEQAHSEGLAKVKAERDAAIRERDAARARVAELESNANAATILAKIRESEWNVASELAAEANAELSAASGWLTKEEREEPCDACDAKRDQEMVAASEGLVTASCPRCDLQFSVDARPTLTDAEREAVDVLRRMSDEQRLEAMSHFCTHCGCEQPETGCGSIREEKKGVTMDKKTPVASPEADFLVFIRRTSGASGQLPEWKRGVLEASSQPTSPQPREPLAPLPVHER